MYHFCLKWPLSETTSSTLIPEALPGSQRSFPWISSPLSLMILLGQPWAWASRLEPPWEPTGGGSPSSPPQALPQFLEEEHLFLRLMDGTNSNSLSGENSQLKTVYNKELSLSLAGTGHHGGYIFPNLHFSPRWYHLWASSLTHNVQWQHQSSFISWSLFMKEEKSRKPPLREIWKLLSKLSCINSLTELFTVWHLRSYMNTNKYKYWDFIFHFFVAAQTKQTLIEMCINRVLDNYTVFRLLKEGDRCTDTCIERCPDERAKSKLKNTMYEMSLVFKKCIEIHNPYTYIDNFWKLYNKNYCRLRMWGLIEDLSLAILHLKFTLWFFCHNRI